MKVKILQEDLLKALTISSRISSTRVQLPVLANILLETQKGKLRIASTNLEISVSQLIGAKIEEEGSITVPSRLITELVSNLKSGQVDLLSEKESLEIKTSDFNSKMTGMNSSDFPNVPQDVSADNIKLSYSIFQSALSKVLFSVSTDETRPSLTGVLVIMEENSLTLVSTDGFRLSQKKIKQKGSSEERRVIIPRNTLSELVRISGEDEIELSFKKSDNQVILGLGNVVLSSRVIDGDFPDFEKIIPKKSEVKVSVDREELLRNVRLASVFAKDSANVLRLELSTDTLSVNAESQQFGSQQGKLDAKIEGDIKDKFTIAFNYRFLEDFLNSMDGDDLQMEFSDPDAPALLLEPKDPDYLHIIMPVRIQS